MKPALSRLRLPAWAGKLFRIYLMTMIGIVIPAVIYLQFTWDAISGLRQLGQYRQQIQSEADQSRHDQELIAQCLPLFNAGAPTCMMQLAPKVSSPLGEVLLASHLKSSGDIEAKRLRLALLQRARTHLRNQMNTPWAQLYRKTYEACQSMISPCPSKLDPPLDNQLLLQKIDQAIAGAY